MKILKRTFFIISGVSALLLLSLFIWFSSVTKRVKLIDARLSFQKESVEVFDGNGEKIPLALDRRFDFSISTLPRKVKLAFVDTEDKRFYRHHGFDYKRMAKAVLINLKTRSFTQGASTISQQLIKNTHLSQEKTLKRKAQEIKLTRMLEKRYSKEKILEKYLNSIYFGHNCFGITSASQFYFGKSPSELTLAEGSILAGLVSSPNHYSPFKNPEKCRLRQQIVLRAMKDQRHVSDAEIEEAKNTPLPSSPNQSAEDKCYLSQVFSEADELCEKLGISLNDKVKIYTYFSPSQQQKIKEIAKDLDCDRAFAVQENATGGFSAFYSTVQNAKRMTGSIIKPLLVYAPAVEEGIISPCTPILDDRTDFGGYAPQNYNNQYFGYVSAKKSLAKSLNVPAVKIFSATGIEKSKEYAKKMGISLAENHLALALGGMKESFSLTDLSSAYATFPRGGDFLRGGFIKRMVLNGKTVYSRPTKGTRVFSEGTAFLMNDMLQETTKTGTAKKLSSLPFSVGAKTGTNGKGDKNYDAYTIAYTTQNTFSVWLGNRDNSPISYTGGGKCAELMQEFLKDFYSAPPPDFPLPREVKKVRLDKIEYDDAHGISLADPLSPDRFVLEEYFLEKYLPKRLSTRFSNPFIFKPNYTFLKGEFTLDLASLPSYYSYLVQRVDSLGGKTVIYEGKWKEKIVDAPPKNATFIYTITPIFQEKKGEPFPLPAVRNQEGESFSPNEIPDIIYDDWWNK